MTLISSVSGIRGTLGGKTGDNLTPIDIVRFASAYGSWLLQNHEKAMVVVGRDARPSGPMIQSLVQQTLISLGIDVIDVGLSTTPTVELEVVRHKAQGGIILTASHNPKEWNALKLLNEKGEFLNAQEGEKINQMSQNLSAIDFANVDDLGSICAEPDAIEHHIEEILNLPLVDLKAIQTKGFKVVVDGVNSSGGIAVPKLLEALGAEVVPIHCEPNGDFPHNPEPLAHHLTDLSEAVVAHQADLGIAVDPDVDRLVFMDEKGTLFGEEYTLVACADYVLRTNPGNTVSNLSSTRALAEVTSQYGGNYVASAVGEAHVVEMMKKTNAVIGGEGNGGVIYPDLHYGRDALVGIALFLSHLCHVDCSVSILRSQYPNWLMRKDKVALSPQHDVDALLDSIASAHAAFQVTTIDGVKIDFPDEWVHIRKSNTEPIIRIYAEAKTEKRLDELVGEIQRLVKE
ncbi:MAG: phosphoglucosamine mutase [Flavobacteriaceae bacterium TMED81]|nr:MAG: phosphoglucosamine mutase [Flavobacteriaceae bacterium TMED81]